MGLGEQLEGVRLKVGSTKTLCSFISYDTKPFFRNSLHYKTLNDTYQTIAAPVLAEIPKVKGSRFIGEAFPVQHTEDVEQRLTEIRKREYNATHWCWAYRMGANGEQTRFNDDGEPSGTAGQPILRQITGRQLTDVLVVITRYYGGTKLGTGGLIRAYGDAAALVLDEATIEEKICRVPVRLTFAYPDTSAAMHCIGKFDAPILSMDYSDETTLTVSVRLTQKAALCESFYEALSGRAQIEDTLP